MTLKDKLEIGLKPDAQYRKDNLPERQVRGPEVPAGPGRSPKIPAARADRTVVAKSPRRQLTARRRPAAKAKRAR